jgi:ferredoxin, 2Fe-2S
MPKITVVDRDGQQRSLVADVGMSLMENLRGNGFDEILALCGGCCSCATCHVHVDPQWTEVVGPALDDEQDLLESSDHRTPQSRLSCQIQVLHSTRGYASRSQPRTEVSA